MRLFIPDLQDEYLRVVGHVDSLVDTWVGNLYMIGLGGLDGPVSAKATVCHLQSVKKSDSCRVLSCCAKVK